MPKKDSIKYREIKVVVRNGAYLLTVCSERRKH